MSRTRKVERRPRRTYTSISFHSWFGVISAIVSLYTTLCNDRRTFESLGYCRIIIIMRLGPGRSRRQYSSTGRHSSNTISTEGDRKPSRYNVKGRQCAAVQRHNAATQIVSHEVRSLNLLHNCSSPRSDQYLCFVIGGDKLIAMSVTFDVYEDYGVPATVKSSDLSVGIIDALDGLTQASARTGNGFLPPPLPGDYYSTMNFTSGDAAIRLEGFPCVGQTDMIIGMEDHTQQFRYSDVALGLDGYMQLALGKRTANEYAGMAFVFEMISVPGSGRYVNDWFGWFSVQSVQAPYIKFSELMQNVYVCDQNGGSGGNGSAIGPGASQTTQVVSPTMASL